MTIYSFPIRIRAVFEKTAVRRMYLDEHKQPVTERESLGWAVTVDCGGTDLTFLLEGGEERPDIQPEDEYTLVLKPREKVR